MNRNRLSGVLRPSILTINKCRLMFWNSVQPQKLLFLRKVSVSVNRLANIRQTKSRKHDTQLSKLSFNVGKISQDVFCQLQLSQKHQIIQNLKRISFNVAKNSLNRPQEKQHEIPILCWIFYSFPVVKPILFNFQPISASFRQSGPI